MSVLLWGPPGTGKTTLAYVLASVTSRRFVEISAVSAGVAQVRAAIDAARGELGLTGRQTLLFIDEVHRFNKAQQDALLPAVENRWVSFIGATTENPSFSVVGPLMSRSLLLRLQPLGDADMRDRDRPGAVGRARAWRLGLAGPAGRDEQLLRLAGGDARRALTYLEAAALGLPDGGVIDGAVLERAVDRAAVRYDRAGDQHYDVISAFIKSIRGSDADAALHYLALMIEAGEDPRFIARRIIVHASEDVGMADPTALPVAIAAAQAVQLVGLPEAQDQPGAGRDPPRACAEVQLGCQGRSTPPRTTSGPAGPERCPRTCGTPATRAPPGSATARATCTRTITQKASCARTTRRPRPLAVATTSRPGTAPRPGTPTGTSGSGRCSTASSRRRADDRDKVGQGLGALAPENRA